MGWLGDLATQIVESLMAGYEALYFPDGNASVARLLVHKLIPATAPHARGFDDIATSRFDYGALDRNGQAVRLRLNSTVVGVRETDSRRVTLDYVRDDEAVSVTADHCVLACYNAAIPHLCPELPERQKAALRYAVKVPLLQTNVLLKDGQALSKLGVHELNCPNDPYVLVTVAPPTTTSGYQPPRTPDDPS
jgi:spermidine dehydrogenase